MTREELAAIPEAGLAMKIEVRNGRTVAIPVLQGYRVLWDMQDYLMDNILWRVGKDSNGNLWKFRK